MNQFHRKLLERIASEPKGRVGVASAEFERALRLAQPLIDDGYLKERRFGIYPGFQILDKGKAFIAGEVVE